VQIGIGLPNTALEVPGRLLVDWAARAEERGFSSLATIDRIAYPSYDSLTALAYFFPWRGARRGVAAQPAHLLRVPGRLAEQVASGASRTPEALRTTAAAFQEAGVDELIFDPTVANLDQVDRLAEEVGDYNAAR
jgi:hypothetical protein